MPIASHCVAGEEGPSSLLLPAPLEPGIYTCKKACPSSPKPSLLQTLLNLSLSVSFSKSWIIFLSLTGSSPVCPCLFSTRSSNLERCRGAGSPLLVYWQHFSHWNPGCFLCCKGQLLASVQLVHQDHQLIFCKIAFQTVNPTLPCLQLLLVDGIIPPSFWTKNGWDWVVRVWEGIPGRQ